MHKLWEDHNLWSLSFLLPARHQPQVQTEPAEDNGDGKGPQGAQSTLHQMHQNNGKILPIGRILSFPERRSRLNGRDFCFKRYVCRVLISVGYTK